MLTASSRAMWAITAFGAIACARDTEDGSGKPLDIPNYNITITLPKAGKLKGESGVIIEALEPREAKPPQGEAEITFGAYAGGAPSSATWVGVTAFVPTLDVLEESWEALIGPHGFPGAKSSASLTVSRDGAESNAESGRITFKRKGKIISGRAEVEPESHEFTFSGTMRFRCLQRNDQGGNSDDPNFESEFCQQYSSLASK